MQMYDCEVRLGGNMLQTVPKYNVTAPEVLVLRAIHGSDAVVKIAPRKNDRRSHKEEIARLKATYGIKAFSSVFGDGYIEKLPAKLDPEELVEGDEAEDGEEEAAAVA